MFTYCLNVRYPECDPQNIVYHGSYLPWLELARSSIIKQYGFSYAEMEKRGIFIIVTDLSIQYKKPAFFDDNIVIFTQIKDMQSLRFSFEYEVRRVNFDIIQGANTLKPEDLEKAKSSELVVTAISSHVWLNSVKRPVRIEKEAPDLYELLKTKIPESFVKKGKL